MNAHHPEIATILTKYFNNKIAPIIFNYLYYSYEDSVKTILENHFNQKVAKIVEKYLFYQYVEHKELVNKICKLVNSKTKTKLKSNTLKIYFMSTFLLDMNRKFIQYYIILKDKNEYIYLDIFFRLNENKKNMVEINLERKLFNGMQFSEREFCDPKMKLASFQNLLKPENKKGLKNFFDEAIKVFDHALSV